MDVALELDDTFYDVKAIETSGWESKVVEHFDQYSATYGEGYERGSIFGYFFRKRQRIVTSLLDGISAGKILDVGCGPGIYCVPCLERGFSYTGLDISKPMIHECGKRFGARRGAAFLVGRLQNLSFADNSFDVILCLGALEYVQAEEETIALAELARVLKPGGTLIFSCANQLSPYRLWGRAYAQLMWIVKRRVTAPIIDFRARLFRRRLQVHRLTAIGTFYFAINLFLSPLEEKCPHQAVWVTSKLERFADGWFGRLGMAFIVVARKDRAVDAIR